ncbi:MAG: AbiV family abortive infection protein [Hydrogenophilales bacterium]|nr:AbiV family abortive infection protein [Hydrogenophilales bacterium]
MNALSLPEVENLRALVLENASELAEEAELLFKHKKFARTYTLAHLSSEELAKLPLLAAVGVNLVNGDTINWSQLDARLRSHSAKLKGSLFVDLLGTNTDPTTRDIQVHEQALSRIELFNELKNVSLYTGVYQDSIYKPNAAITEKLASEALTAARNRLELFSTVEAVTHGRVAELAKRESYMKLLNTLSVGRDG